MRAITQEQPEVLRAISFAADNGLPIGKQPIKIPDAVKVSLQGDTVSVKGPRGENTRTFKKGDIKISSEDGHIRLELLRPTLFGKALWGTYASHVENMIAGVNKLFEKKLMIEGVGYRAEVKGKNLVLNIGFSHSVSVPIPEDVKVVTDKNIMTMNSINKESLGQFAAYIRSLKKPEPYKGKGIRYIDEVLRRKQGKKAA